MGFVRPRSTRMAISAWPAASECKFSMRMGSWFIGRRGQSPNKLGANLKTAWLLVEFQNGWASSSTR